MSALSSGSPAISAALARARSRRDGDVYERREAMAGGRLARRDFADGTKR